MNILGILLLMQLVSEKENSRLKALKLHLKIDLVSHPVHVNGLGE